MSNSEELHAALKNRDARGGAEYWLAHGRPPSYPMLAIRVSQQYACVTYFPMDRHPGFRCISDLELPTGETTTFVFDGCDPYDGEDEPNEFVLQAETAIAIANRFMHNQELPIDFDWLEL